MTRRLATAYVVLFAVSAALAVTSFGLGRDERAEPSVAGVYRGDQQCRGRFRLEQSGQFVGASGALRGSLRLRHGRLTGGVGCDGGPGGRLDVRRTARQLHGTLARRPFRARLVEAVPHTGVPAVPERPPPSEEVFGRLMLAIAVVILAARLLRLGVERTGQPPVMGEVLAGILLGPTLLGAVAPGVQDYLFPSYVVPLLRGAADIGLAFYMFLVGMELDPRLLRGRVAHAAAISNASVLLPLALGILVALPLYELLAPADTSFAAFALFMGVAMSITAFPVLARILVERRMLRKPIGALALSAAAVDDVTAWGLLALATAIAGRGSALGTLPVLGYVLAFCAAMALLARPLLGRVASAYDEAGGVPGGWIAAIFVGVLLSSYASMEAGVAAIFGAFVMGLVMPRRAGLSHDVARRLDYFVPTVLLPLFFVVTGLKTDVGLLDRPELWALALLLLGVAIAGKWVGATVVARVAGYRWRDAGVLGALMNTRGLTELIVLNVGLELGVISRALFTMLVLMALVTTFMAAPAIRLLDPRRELAAGVEEELAVAGEADWTILVAPLEERNVDELLALALPLARTTPGAELVVVRALPPPRVPTSLSASDRELEQATRELERMRAASGTPTHVAAFTSATRGDDVARLAADTRADLLLVDGRRPLLGGGGFGGEIAALLARAPCDVAVLVERELVPTLDEEHPVVVPFGDEGDDRGALELATRLADATGAPLRVVDPAALDTRDAGLVVLGVGRSVARDAPALFVRRAR